MTTNVYAPDKERLVLQGDEGLIFEKGMIVALPHLKRSAKVKEAVFVLRKPTLESNLVSISQEVFLEYETEEETK